MIDAARPARATTAPTGSALARRSTPPACGSCSTARTARVGVVGPRDPRGDRRRRSRSSTPSPTAININVRCGATAPASLAEAVVAARRRRRLRARRRRRPADRRRRDRAGSSTATRSSASSPSTGSPAARCRAAAWSCRSCRTAGSRRVVEAAGGQVVRTPVGDKYILEGMQVSGAGLGGEKSGHVIVLEHTTSGDGIVTALEVLRVMATARPAAGRPGRARSRCCPSSSAR